MSMPELNGSGSAHVFTVMSDDHTVGPVNLSLAAASKQNRTD